MSITFSLISQDKVVTETEADVILLPTTEGQIAVLPHHVQLISRLKTGEVVAKIGSKTDHFAVFGGVAQVMEREVVVLADRAEHVDEIDLAKAEHAMKDAEKLRDTAVTDIELAHAYGLIERNLNRIAVVRRHRSRRHTI